MKSEKTDSKKSTLKWLKRISIFLAVLLLAPTILFTIGWFNRNLLIDELQEWYEENNNGKLEIGQVDATFFSAFPNVGFTIRDIYQVSFDTILDKNSSLSIEKAQVSISVTDLLSGNIEFRNINIENAKIYTQVVTKKSVGEYVRLKKDQISDSSQGFDFPSWINKERTNFRLQNVKFIAKDSMLNRYFNLIVEEAQGRIRSEEENISGNINFRVFVNDLGFNTKKGSFVNGEIIRGNPEFTLFKSDNIISIPAFPLEVGEEIYNTKADFDFNEITGYHFTFENNSANFQEIKNILPDSISSKLSLYHIAEPIDIRFSLKGKFEYGDVPYMDGDFSTSNNRTKIGDSLELENVNFTGYLTNTLMNDEEPENTEPLKKDFKVFFENFSANIEDVQIAANNSYYQTSNKARNFVNASVKVYGSNETLASLLQTDNFDFIGGTFNLQTDISGNIANAYEVFNFANGNFSLKNTRVVLQKNKLQLPVEVLDLRLENETSTLQRLKINLPNGENLIFRGEITNVASLLANDPSEPASANVILDSDALDINELITTTMEFIPASEKSDVNSNTLHETLEAIYKKFQPRFRLNLRTVSYNDINFNNLIANIVLKDAETVQLDNLEFNYNDAFADLQGNLRIPEAGNNINEPIFLNVAAKSSGPIGIFQDIFNIQLLNIRGGDYIFTGNITGNVQKFEQLLNNANGDLKLLNANFYYPEADIDIEFDSMKVAVNNSNIMLDRFVLEVGDHDPFALQGKIENYPGFLIDAVEQNGKILIGLDASFIDMDKWMETVNSMDSKEKSTAIKNRDLAAIFRDIYVFHPEFTMNIDSLKYTNLVSEDLSASVYFENDSILKLDDFNIRYKNSKGTVNGKLAAHNIINTNTDKNPFNFDFSAQAEGKSKDLNDLLQTVNFVLRSGDFKFNGSYNGQAEDLKILNSNVQGDLSLGSTMVDIQSTDIRVPIDSLHLEIKNNLASLQRLDVDLPGKSAIDITGEIDNFSNFINNDQQFDSHRSSFKVRSEYLSSSDIKKFIGKTKKRIDTTDKQPFELQNLKEILNNLNTSYYPSADIQIDSLVYNDISVSHFATNIGFENDGSIMIEDTRLNYINGAVKFSIKTGVSDPEFSPVDVRMNISDIDLNRLAQDFNYFNIEELRNSEKISGNLNLVLDAEGILNKEGNIIMDSLNGTVQLNLRDLAIYDFDPVLDKVVLLKEERFEKLRFRPISQTFEVRNGNVIIPRTQIQSSALQLYVEGEFKIGEYFNIWLSLPWNNILKSRDGIALPEKISFDEAGAKFYLQIVQDKDNQNPSKQKLKTKFRLGNSKLEKLKEQ